MQVARARRCARTEVHHVLGPKDGIGAGFIMQWLDGEALGARIVRAPELDEIRPQLARLFGETLASIHRIDLTTTGLDQQLQHLGRGLRTPNLGALSNL